MSVIPLRGGPGAWEADPDPRYWNMMGPWGGWTAGLMLEAVLAEPGRNGSPVSMTMHFMAGFTEAPVQIATRLVKGGRSLSFWSSEVSQNGVAVAHGIVTLAVRPQTDVFRDKEMPLVAAPEDVATVQRPPGENMGPRFFQMCETKGIKNYPGLSGEAGDTQSIAWVRDVEHRPLDYVMVAMLADLYPPRIFLRRPARAPATTVSMTVYFHGSDEELGAVGDDFILAEAEGRHFNAGTFDHHAALWRRDGVLLATSEQLCWFK